MAEAEKPGDRSECPIDGVTEETHTEETHTEETHTEGVQTGEEPTELPAEDWAESAELGWPEISPQELSAYGATVRRIEWMIAVAGVVCAAAVAWPLGWALAGGVLLGTVLGWINFRWLAESVNAIGERIVNVRSRERGAAVVARGVGRIFLIALFGYGIFAYSLRGVAGFLAGLTMPVIALMFEAMFEIVANIRRSS